MDFLKLSPVFSKCSVLFLNIPLEEDHIVCISQLWMIVTRQSGYKFLIPAADNFSDEQCTITFDTDVVPTVGYSDYIILDKTVSLYDHSCRVG